MKNGIIFNPPENDKSPLMNSDAPTAREYYEALFEYAFDETPATISGMVDSLDDEELAKPIGESELASTEKVSLKDRMRENIARIFDDEDFAEDAAPGLTRLLIAVLRADKTLTEQATKDLLSGDSPEFLVYILQSLWLKEVWESAEQYTKMYARYKRVGHTAGNDRPFDELVELARESNVSPPQLDDVQDSTD